MGRNTKLHERHVCMCVHVLCTYVCAPACICPWGWKPKVNLGFHSSGTVHLVGETGFSLSCCLLIWLGSGDLSVFNSPDAGITYSGLCPRFLFVLYGSEDQNRSSNLQSPRQQKFFMVFSLHFKLIHFFPSFCFLDYRGGQVHLLIYPFI